MVRRHTTIRVKRLHPVCATPRPSRLIRIPRIKNLRTRVRGGDHAALPGVALGKRVLPLLHARCILRGRRIRRAAIRCGRGRDEPSPSPAGSVRGPPRVRGNLGSEVPCLHGARDPRPARATCAWVGRNPCGGGRVLGSGTGNGGPTPSHSLLQPQRGGYRPRDEWPVRKPRSPCHHNELGQDEAGTQGTPSPIDPVWFRSPAGSQDQH